MRTWGKLTKSQQNLQMRTTCRILQCTLQIWSYFHLRLSTRCVITVAMNRDIDNANCTDKIILLLRWHSLDIFFSFPDMRYVCRAWVLCLKVFIGSWEIYQNAQEKRNNKHFIKWRCFIEVFSDDDAELYSLSGKTSNRRISCSLKAAIFSIRYDKMAYRVIDLTNDDVEQLLWYTNNAFV